MQKYRLNIKSFIRLIRPYQWIKNLLLFSPVFFSGDLTTDKIVLTSSGVFVFCLISGIGYIVNDWFDRERDKFHPQKRNRPFSSGKVSGKAAWIMVLILFAATVSVILFFALPHLFLLYTLLYILMTISYTLFFKSIPTLEIFIVAIGFDIRILAGGAASGIAISNWLFLTVFFIALMISIAKRVNEYKELGEEYAPLHRHSQAAYSENYLNSMLWSSGGVTLVVYALYAVEHGTLVVFSIVPATYGIFRFLYLTDLGKGSDPIRTLFADRQLLLTTLIFLLFLSIVIYH